MARGGVNALDRFLVEHGQSPVWGGCSVRFAHAWFLGVQLPGCKNAPLAIFPEGPGHFSRGAGECSGRDANRRPPLGGGSPTLPVCTPLNRPRPEPTGCRVFRKARRGPGHFSRGVHLPGCHRADLIACTLPRRPDFGSVTSTLPTSQLRSRRAASNTLSETWEMSAASSLRRSSVIGIRSFGSIVGSINRGL